MYSETTTIKTEEGIASADLGGEAVLLDVNSGMYYGLNDVGARILDLAQTPITLASLTDTLLEEYEGVDRPTLAADVSAFVEKLAAANLVRVVGE